MGQDPHFLLQSYILKEFPWVNVVQFCIQLCFDFSHTMRQILRNIGKRLKAMHDVTVSVTAEIKT